MIAIMYLIGAVLGFWLGWEIRGNYENWKCERMKSSGEK